jgi:hypothetical protein
VLVLDPLAVLLTLGLRGGRNAFEDLAYGRNNAPAASEHASLPIFFRARATTHRHLNHLKVEVVAIKTVGELLSGVDATAITRVLFRLKILTPSVT